MEVLAIKMNEIERLQNSNQSLLQKLKWFESKYGPYYETKGLKNWKNLFRKPTLMEGTIFLMMLLCLFGAYAYSIDTKLCRETLENLPLEVCEACREFELNRGIYEAENKFKYGDINITFFNDTGVEE